MIRGLLHSNSELKYLYNTFDLNNVGYHAWNTIKLNNGKTMLIDIMNPEFNGERLNYSNNNLKHLYAIPSLDVDKSTKETLLKQKIASFDIN